MDYKPGLIAASFKQGKKKSGGGNALLTQLFSKTTLPPTSKVTDGNKKKVLKKKIPQPTENGIKPNPVAKAVIVDKTVVIKRKIEEPISITKAKKAKNDSSVSESRNQSSNISTGFPFLHESFQVDSSQKKAKKVKVKKVVKKRNTLDDETTSRKRNRRDKTSDKRTVFIGNCPLSSDKKVMTNLFKDFGAIESIRFRCGPAAQLDLPRRAVIIKKEFHEKASSYVCYIVFKAEDSAQSALQMNGHVLDGLHLRVDLASNHKKHDKKRSVFVGNLPFTVTEEDLRSHFNDCGEISNVRIVRDRQTSVGKGIAYVQFEGKDGVTLAKKLNAADFQGRQLRIMTCTNKPVKKPDVKPHMKNKPFSKPDGHQEKKRINFAPSNRKSAPTNTTNTNSKKTFTEMLQSKKEKRLKKKKQVSQKTDGLSSIFGDMSADMKKLKTANPKMREKKEKKPRGKGKAAQDKKGKGNFKKVKGKAAQDKKGKGNFKKGKGPDKKGKKFKSMK